MIKTHPNETLNEAFRRMVPIPNAIEMSFEAWYESEYKMNPCRVKGELHPSPAWKAWQHQQAEIATLKAENERYKNFLIEVKNGGGICDDNDDCPLCMIEDFLAINTQGGNKNG